MKIKIIKADLDCWYSDYIGKIFEVDSFNEKLQHYFINADEGYSIALEDCKIVEEEKALRYNDGKLRWSLVHFKSLEPMVQVLEYGAKKYTPENWKKGLDKKEILESLMRHLIALMDGEEYDPESNLHHIGHIQCNAMFYSYFIDK